MKKTGISVLVVLLALSSCNRGSMSDNARQKERNDRVAGHDGGVTLLIKDADLIQVDSNPQYNTAEWQVTVKEPGRYDVWLSSLTCDTLHMEYAQKVTITAGDSRIEKRPVGDEIVTSDRSVRKPWYRADSHMGSIFFSEPGEYQVQVISDKVVPHSSDPASWTLDKHTLINSVILKPMIN